MPIERQPQPEEVRRSSRESRRPNTLTYFVSLNEAYFEGFEFKDQMSYKQAMSSEHFEK